jgi:hypothetical protein
VAGEAETLLLVPLTSECSRNNSSNCSPGSSRRVRCPSVSTCTVTSFKPIADTINLLSRLHLQCLNHNPLTGPEKLLSNNVNWIYYETVTVMIWTALSSLLPPAPRYSLCLCSCRRQHLCPFRFCHHRSLSRHQSLYQPPFTLSLPFPHESPPSPAWPTLPLVVTSAAIYTCYNANSTCHSSSRSHSCSHSHSTTNV